MRKDKILRERKKWLLRHDWTLRSVKWTLKQNDHVIKEPSITPWTPFLEVPNPSGPISFE